MIRTVHTLFIVSCIAIPSTAQFSVLGADAYGMANSTVAIASYASVYHNPGAIGALKDSFISAGYMKTLPVEGFHTIGLQGVFVNRVLTSGFSADSFGDTYYRESRFGLALAKQSDKVSMGLKMSYMSVNIHEMSNRNALLGEAGMLVSPNRFFSLGLHVINFTGARLYGETGMPVILAFGAAIHPGNKVSISSQVDYPFKSSPRFRMGLNYKIREEISLSTGINPDMRAIHFGSQVMIKQYGFCYAVATHPNVGLAHNLSLIYKISE